MLAQLTLIKRAGTEQAWLGTFSPASVNDIEPNPCCNCAVPSTELVHFGHKHADLTASPNRASICPFCEGKKKEQQFTTKYLHETGTRTPYLLFCREPHHSLHASTLRRAHHPPPPTPFFGVAKKTILNGKFPRKLCQS